MRTFEIIAPMPYSVAVKPTNKTSAFITYFVNTGTTVINIFVDALIVNVTDKSIIKFIKSSLPFALFITKVIA